MTEDATRILERDTELTALLHCLDEGQRGAGSVVVVSGETGAGTSTLLDTLAERARGRGLRVLTARGLELEQYFPFGLALRLVDPTLFDLGLHERNRLLTGTAAPARQLLDGDDVGFDPDLQDLSRGTDRAGALVHALVQLVARLSRPVEGRGGGVPVLVVDDLHWTDPLSLRVLLALAAEARDTPLTMVVGIRADGDVGSELLDRVLAQPGVRSLPLRPLTAQGVGLRIGRDFPGAHADFVTAAHELTTGNPYYVDQLVRAAREAGFTGAAIDVDRLADLVPAGVRGVVLTAFRRLPEKARALAWASAVLGDESPLRRAACLAGLDPEEAESLSDQLVEAGLLSSAEPLRFRHPVDRAVVTGQLSVLAHSRAHRRAADVLLREGAPVEEVTRHLLACRAAADPEVVELLRRAGARSAAAGDYRTARRVLARALQEPPPDDGTRAALLGELALAEVGAGDPAGVDRLDQALEVTDDPVRRARLHFALARMQFSLSRFEAAAASLAAAHAELPSGDPLAAEMVLDELLLAPLVPARQQAAAGQLARLGKDAFAGRLDGGDAPLLALVAGAMVAMGRPAQDVRRVAAAAVADGRDRFYDLASGYAVLALLAVDEPELARPVVERSLEQAERTGSLIGLGFSTHWLAALQLHIGQLNAVVATAERNLAIARAGWGICLHWVAPILATAAVELGRLDDAEAALALCADAEGIELAQVLQARARLATARGDAAGALDGSLAAGRLLESSGHPVQPTTSAWRSEAALAANSLGERSLAVRLVDEELRMARGVGAPRTLGVALRAAGLVAGHSAGLAMLEESVRVLAGSPSRLEYARSLSEWGAAQRLGGDLACARTVLREAVAVAQECGAAPLAERAVHELRAAGGRRSTVRETVGLLALTATEVRIARLAAGGCSTAEMARELYVSPKTIGWHLTNVYRKLGVRSRGDLAERLRSLA